MWILAVLSYQPQGTTFDSEPGKIAMVHAVSERLPAEPIKQKRGSKRATAIRLISGLLAVYWGLLLPFICWGAWATPGHPHSSPHLVFFEPLHAVNQPATSAQDASPPGWLWLGYGGLIADLLNPAPTPLTPHQHTHTEITGSAPQATLPAAEPDNTGQSTPTLAIMLLVILIPFMAILLSGWRRSVLRVAQMIFPGTVALPLSIPPPRLFLAASA